MFRSRKLDVFLILALSVGTSVLAEGTVREGLTADRLVVRDPAGRVQFYVERTITGRTVIRTPDGSVVGTVQSPREEREEREPRRRLTLPWD